jgi:DNA-binding CsgD family transcriptional regulator
MFITPSEVSDIVRLIGECRELGDDAVRWRQHFFAGLARLVGADLVLGGEMGGCLGGELTSPGTTAWGFEQGFNVAGWELLMEWFAQDPFIPITFREFIGEMRKVQAANMTVARQQLISDHQWYRSPDYQDAVRTMGTDAMQHSFCQLPGTDNEFSGFLIHREAGRRQFDEHEVALVDIAHREVARLIGGALTRWDEPAPSSLPARMRQVLRCLLEGDGDKHVASRLNLSAHTVNYYTKQIYRHFGVTSRSELLARWLRRGWSNQAHWDDTQIPIKLDIPV